MRMGYGVRASEIAKTLDMHRASVWKIHARFLNKRKEVEYFIVSKIKEAYEKLLGREVPHSTIYRMLERHGWRKIAPTPSHPKADPQAQEAFKKLCIID